jgi:hypothetical protein
MLKHFAILYLAFSTTLAQSSTSSSNDTANPLIPSGISSSCSQFMNDLDNNSTLSACTTPLQAATQQFGTGGSASQTDVTNALDTICSAATASACPDSLLRGKLTDFYAQCSPELTTKAVPGVLNVYDVLFALSPFRTAICTKDNNDKYCILKNNTSGTQSAFATVDTSQEILQHLANSPSPVQRRADTSSTTPNMTTFLNNNILFDFLQPSMGSDQLCTTCTREIFNAYSNFETQVQYAPGLSQSQLLGGQMNLYKAINSTCGPDFLQTSVQAAGGISGSSLFSGATQTANGPGSVFTVALGLISLAIISFF